MRRSRIWIVMIMILAALVSILLLSDALPIDERRAFRKLQHAVGPFLEGNPLSIRIARPSPDKVEILDHAGPRLLAALYLPIGKPAPQATVLLLHGNRGQGARHPLYRLIADRLARENVLVLALNLRGFGGSDPAPAGKPVMAADLGADAERGLRALDELSPPGVPKLVVGHSLGANVALRFFAGREGVRVVAIEPGRRLRERVIEPPAPDLPAFTRKFALRGGVQNHEMIRTLYRDLDPETPSSSVPPGSVVIVQGRGISARDRKSIENAAAARPNTELRWLDSTSHEFGVAAIAEWVIYPGDLMSELINSILSISENEADQRGIANR